MMVIDGGNGDVDNGMYKVSLGSEATARLVSNI